MKRPEELMREIEASLHIIEDLNLDAVLQGVADGAPLLAGVDRGCMIIMDDSGQLQDFITPGLTKEDH